jgi:hypothetical protein
MIIIYIFTLNANGSLPGGSGTTVRHNTPQTNGRKIDDKAKPGFSSMLSMVYINHLRAGIATGYTLWPTGPSLTAAAGQISLSFGSTVPVA